jgi:hypothetical protein
MKKLSLNLDSLEVESFEASSRRSGIGTVRGYDDESDTTAPCWADTIEGPPCDSTGFQILCTCTYGGPNNGTCDATCNTEAVTCE